MASADLDVRVVGDADLLPRIKGLTQYPVRVPVDRIEFDAGMPDTADGRRHRAIPGGRAMQQTTPNGEHRIVARQDFSDVTYLLEVEHPMMARAAKPGQFVIVMGWFHGL